MEWRRTHSEKRPRSRGVRIYLKHADGRIAVAFSRAEAQAIIRGEEYKPRADEMPGPLAANVRPARRYL